MAEREVFYSIPDSVGYYRKKQCPAMLGSLRCAREVGHRGRHQVSCYEWPVPEPDPSHNGGPT